VGIKKKQNGKIREEKSANAFSHLFRREEEEKKSNK
jgi:hypothetical protein